MFFVITAAEFSVAECRGDRVCGQRKQEVSSAQRSGLRKESAVTRLLGGRLGYAFYFKIFRLCQPNRWPENSVFGVCRV